jgi:hypothetical protein
VIRFAARAALVTIVLAARSRLPAATLEFEPFHERPAAVTTLGAGSEIEAYAVAPGAPVAAIARPGAGGASILRYARGGDEPRDVPLAGTLVGLVMVADGTAAYGIVRVSNKKGVLRNTDLVRIDLASARASTVATLPATAAGLAITSDGAALLVASKDEIRSFVLPAIASGRLYRALGDNVGVVPIGGTSHVVVAQRSRLVLADLAAPQGRDGLEFKEESPTPAPLRGMLTTTGEAGPIVLGDGGLLWRVRIGDLPAPPVVIPPEPPPAEPAAQEVPPPPPPPAAAPPVAQEPPVADSSPAGDAPKAAPVVVAPRDVPGEAGTVSGSLSGPALAEVAAVVFLGPDNVLREAGRAVPDPTGHFSVSALQPGAYRLVAAGKGGRVLVCRPPYIAIRVGPNSAVEAPVLEVIRAP